MEKGKWTDWAKCLGFIIALFIVSKLPTEWAIISGGVFVVFMLLKAGQYIEGKAIH